MQTLALHDTVTIYAGERECDSGPADNFQLTCSDPSLPTDHRNLVTQAAKYIIQEYNITQPIRIHLEKRIPQGAGLAGGSSDCAATLAGLNTLLKLNIPLHINKQCTKALGCTDALRCTKALGCTNAQQSSNYQHPKSMIEIGQQFGADVPFCLLGGTALAEGIGEKLTPLPSHPHCWVVLVYPDIHVSTAEIFKRYSPNKTALNETTDTIEMTNNSDKVIAAITNKDLNCIAQNFSNDLAHVTASIHPIITELINQMKIHGALGSAMSGSGPTVFGYFDTLEAAQKTQKAMAKLARRAFLTEIKNH